MGAPKSADSVFYALYFVCFLLFATEVVVNSILKEGYKFSFVFWLEIVAALALVPNIEWLAEGLEELFGMDTSAEAADVPKTGPVKGSNVSGILYNVLTSFLFIKLLRVVKLYKYCVQAVATDEDDSEPAEEPHQDSQSVGGAPTPALLVEAQSKPRPGSESSLQTKLKQELDPTELGKIVSDSTTRKVMIGVLLMYIMYPLLTYTPSSNLFRSGLKSLFIAGSSSCSDPNNLMCGKQYLTPLGWVGILDSFVKMGKESPGLPDLEVLWIYAPNYLKGGKVEDITAVPDGLGGVIWTQSPGCAGQIVSTRSDCELRVEEMSLVSYSPPECRNGEVKGCDELVLYTRLDLRKIKTQTALYHFLMVIFTTALLFVAAVSVGNDTTRIVVNPTAKMVAIVKKMTDNPLKKHDLPQGKSEDKDKNAEDDSSTLKTRVLEQVLYKITKLVQMGYGGLGAQIVRENMLTPEGDINIMVNGVTVFTVFLVCRINYFAEITEALQEEITVFVNKFGKIIHDCADYWGGSINKNAGEVFLMTWKLPNAEAHENEGMRETALAARAQNAVRSLVASVKILAEIRRAADLKAYARHPKIKNKYSCQLSC